MVMFATKLLEELGKIREITFTSACYAHVNRMERKDEQLLRELQETTKKSNWDSYEVDKATDVERQLILYEKLGGDAKEFLARAEIPSHKVYEVFLRKKGLNVDIPDYILLLGKKRYCSYVYVEGNDFDNSGKTNELFLTVYSDSSVWSPDIVSSALAQTIENLGYKANFKHVEGWAYNE